MKKTRFFVLSLLCACVMPMAAGAQSKITTGTDEAGVAFSDKYYLTAPSRIGIRLLRNPALGADGFVVRLSAMDAISGCARLGKPNATVTYNNMYADITMGSYTVDFRDLPLNPNACKKDSQVPFADVVLDKAQLQAQGVNKVRFNYGPFSDTYNMEIGTHFVRLEKGQGSSKHSANVYEAQTGYDPGTPLELGFMPEDTLMLYAPAVPTGVDATAAIEAMATARGLEPLREDDGLRLPGGAAKAYYFTDPKNTYAGKLQGDAPQLLGSVAVSKTVYGLQGNEVVSRDYDVYMKKPTLHE